MILPPLVEHIGVQQTAAERRLQVYPGDAKDCYEAKTPPGSKGAINDRYDLTLL